MKFYYKRNLKNFYSHNYFVFFSTSTRNKNKQHDILHLLGWIVQIMTKHKSSAPLAVVCS